MNKRTALLKLNETKFPASDAIMSRCISTAISMVWTDEQIKEKGEKMVAVIKKVLQQQMQQA
jgi:8-amino-3,8-dideoxy-alpha-D-manno-octulosonate transaminase